MKIRKRPADAVVGNRQLSARVLGLPYDRFWVVSCHEPDAKPIKRLPTLATFAKPLS